MSKEQRTEQAEHSVSGVPDDEEELLQVLTDLRVNKKMNMRQIAHETGLALSKVGKMLKGVGVETESDEKTIDKEPPQRKPQYMTIMIRQEEAAKLYALAIDEGFNGVEDFLEKSMLPWYRVKRDFEWKLKTKIQPKQFQLYIETCMTDSLELQQLKEQWSKQLATRKAPEGLIPSLPAGSTAGGGQN